MAQVNPTEFAILGLLAEQPRSGYDIKKEVGERLGHFWSESFGHIYPMLRRLRTKRLVSSRTERSTAGRPARRVYEITERGRAALEAWFVEPPPPVRPRNELLLRIFLGRHAPPETLARDISAYREQVDATLERLREVRREVAASPDAGEDALYWELALDYGIEVFTSLAKWSARAERRLRGP